MNKYISPGPVDEELDSIARTVVDSAFAVHCALGPGLLESVYETCLLREFSFRNVKARCQVHLPIVYRDCRLDTGLRLDMVVEDRLLVEVKAVETLLPVHKAQVLTYLKLSNMRLGLLINFNVPLIKDGIHRIVR
jgi:GxxExxY protein